MSSTDREDVPSMLRRIETRLCRFMVANGISPHGTIGDLIDVKQAEPGVVELHLPSWSVSLGDLYQKMSLVDAAEYVVFVGGKERLAIVREGT